MPLNRNSEFEVICETQTLGMFALVLPILSPKENWIPTKVTLPAETRNAIWAIGGTVYAADSKSVISGFESQIAHHKELFDFFKKLWYNIYVEKIWRHRLMV